MIFICKLDSSGNFKWARHYSSNSYYNYGNDVSVDRKGNVFVTGYFDNTIDFDPGPGIFNLWGNSIDIFVLKLNSMGDFIWAKKMGGPFSDGASSITVDNTGNVYTTGDFRQNADFDPGLNTYNLSPLNGYQDAFISKLDSMGNFIWVKQIGGNGEDAGCSIQIGNGGHIYVSGNFSGSADFDPGPSTYYINSTWKDLFVCELDSSGSFFCAGRQGGTGTTELHSMVLDAKGKILHTGNFDKITDFDPCTGTYTMDANSSSGYLSGYISKLESCQSIVVESSEINQDQNISIFPNPCNGLFTLSYSDQNSNFEIKIINTLGEIVFTKTNLFSLAPLDLSSYPKGIYFLQLETNNQTALGKIIIE